MNQVRLSDLNRKRIGPLPNIFRRRRKNIEVTYPFPQVIIHSTMQLNLFVHVFTPWCKYERSAKFNNMSGVEIYRRMCSCLDLCRFVPRPNRQCPVDRCPEASRGQSLHRSSPPKQQILPSVTYMWFSSASYIPQLMSFQTAFCFKYNSPRFGTTFSLSRLIARKW